MWISWLAKNRPPWTHLPNFHLQPASLVVTLVQLLCFIELNEFNRSYLGSDGMHAEHIQKMPKPSLSELNAKNTTINHSHGGGLRPQGTSWL